MQQRRRAGCFFHVIVCALARRLARWLRRRRHLWNLAIRELAQWPVLLLEIWRVPASHRPKPEVLLASLVWGHPARADGLIRRLHSSLGIHPDQVVDVEFRSVLLAIDLLQES